MGQQPVAHLVDHTFLLYVLNGLLSCTAVLMQPLWSPDRSVSKPKERVPASIRAASRGHGNTKAPATTTLEKEAPVSIGLVPLPLQFADGEGKGNGTLVHCRGVYCAAGVVAQTALHRSIQVHCRNSLPVCCYTSHTGHWPVSSCPGHCSKYVLVPV